MSKKLLNESKNINLIEQKINELLTELNGKECKLSLDKKAYILSNLALRQFDIEEYKGNVVDYKPKVEDELNAKVEFEENNDSINQYKKQKPNKSKMKDKMDGRSLSLSRIEGLFREIKQKNR